ncbi:MAG: hypothetical protein ACQUHE_01120, partial [Bacteroidia bacterium]
PAPDAGVESVGAENFEWVVETAASFAIEKAKAQQFGKDNLTWGEYVRTGASATPLVAKSPASAKKKSIATTKTTTKAKGETSSKKATAKK